MLKKPLVKATQARVSPCWIRALLVVCSLLSIFVQAEIEPSPLLAPSALTSSTLIPSTLPPLTATPSALTSALVSKALLPAVDPRFELNNSEGKPAGLIAGSQSAKHLFWVDLDQGLLFRLERTPNGHYRQRNIVRISIGKQGFGKSREGDLKTPVGVYKITSFLTDKQLDERYGMGAYPLNYPNIWDRISSRTGHGIWLHGHDRNIAQRPRFDSDGCIVIDNETLEKLESFITIGESQLILGRSMQWLKPTTAQAEDDILPAIEQWRQDWEGLNNNAYLAHYAVGFSDTRRNLAEWKAYKTRVNRNKRQVGVNLTKLSVITYPGEENMVAVRFYQRYTSNNFNWAGWKHLLWRRNDEGQWRIFYEGNG